MPRLEYFIVSESIAIDSQTNRVSIFNVLEEIQSPGFPTLLPNTAIIAVWIAEAGDDQRDFQVVFSVAAPGENEPRRFPVNFRIPQARARTVIQLVGYPVPGPGEIAFAVELNGQYIASHTAIVAMEVPPPPPPTVQ